MLEQAKWMVEKMTGIGRPRRTDLAELVRPRKPQGYHFLDDGQTPNNRHFSLLLYRSPVALPAAYDPAAIFEDLFAANDWRHSWRNGIYDFLHFHTGTHEVLGIARGHAVAQFGGERGRIIDLKAGDVVVLPAGTGHRRRSASPDLLVVGAYPAGGDFDQRRPGEIAHADAVRKIAAVGLPAKDPIYGDGGPLLHAWSLARRA